MKTKATLLLVAAMFCLVGIAQAIVYNIAKVNINVVDEAGVPIAGAKVGVGFDKDKGLGVDEIAVIGTTDRLGKFWATSRSDSNFIGFNVQKDGYYKSTGKYLYKSRKLNMWQPWNPEITVVMRKIGNQVPMYARDSKFSKLEIPVIGEKVGFDLTRFDWVPPYGAGVHADFIFKLEKRVKDRKDFEATLEVTFPNPEDGILLVKEDRQYGSEFKLPRLAPDVSYNNTLRLAESRNPGERIARNFEFNEEHNNYIFRIRSEKKNEKIDAIYGKIHGPFSFDPIFSKTATITIKYYLNPDYTRNLEYDPNRNLFGPLPSLQQVGVQ